jgi:hypothetical protein
VPGIDVRADGGYAIWWPREGLPIEDWPMCEWPEWLLELARGGGTNRYRSTSLPPFPRGDVSDFTVALRKLDPCCWRDYDR